MFLQSALSIGGRIRGESKSNPPGAASFEKSSRKLGYLIIHLVTHQNQRGSDSRRVKKETKVNEKEALETASTGVPGRPSHPASTLPCVHTSLTSVHTSLTSMHTPSPACTSLTSMHTPHLHAHLSHLHAHLSHLRAHLSHLCAHLSPTCTPLSPACTPLTCVHTSHLHPHLLLTCVHILACVCSLIVLMNCPSDCPHPPL